jgi:protein-disulfide isomerase
MTKAGERFLFWLVVVVILVGAVYGVYRAATTPADIPLPTELTAEDQIKGNPESDVILIEYSDFQCPACASYYYLVEEILDEFGAHMQFTYRHFPLKSIHNKAVLAAVATEAAGMQDEYWGMYSMIFENQLVWSPMSVQDAENEFIKYAAELDLDTKKFMDDIKSSAAEDLVEAEFQSAVEGGLNSTPTFFLNGERVKNPKDLEEFRTLIRDAIEKSNT